MDLDTAMAMLKVLLKNRWDLLDAFLEFLEVGNADWLIVRGSGSSTLLLLTPDHLKIKLHVLVDVHLGISQFKTSDVRQLYSLILGL